jgi:hypothetical protein
VGECSAIEAGEGDHLLERRIGAGIDVLLPRLLARRAPFTGRAIHLTRQFAKTRYALVSPRPALLRGPTSERTGTQLGNPSSAHFFIFSHFLVDTAFRARLPSSPIDSSLVNSNG